jgi:hypothetical protein
MSAAHANAVGNRRYFFKTVACRVFLLEETPDKPKWPMGGMFTHMWQQTRQRFSGEKKSKFSDQDWDSAT